MKRMILQNKHLRIFWDRTKENISEYIYFYVKRSNIKKLTCSIMKI